MQKIMAMKVYKALIDAGVKPLAPSRRTPSGKVQNFLFVDEFTGSWVPVRKASIVEYYEFLLVLAKLGLSSTIDSCHSMGLDSFWVMEGEPDGSALKETNMSMGQSDAN